VQAELEKRNEVIEELNKEANMLRVKAATAAGQQQAPQPSRDRAPSSADFGNTMKAYVLDKLFTGR